MDQVEEEEMEEELKVEKEVGMYVSSFITKNTACENASIYNVYKGIKLL